jgi:outer membrane immunogenic protein
MEGIAVKKTLVAGMPLLLILSVGSAFGADLPSHKAPPNLPPPPPPPLWTGFYIGLNAGGTWSQSNNVDTASSSLFGAPLVDGDAEAGPFLSAVSAASASGSISAGSSGGFVGGGGVGYNWQFGNVFVAGIETDIQGVAGAHGGGSGVSALSLGSGLAFFAPNRVPDLVSTSISAAKRVDYIGTLRARLGYLVTPTLLAYATGGLAYGGVSASVSMVQANTDRLNFGSGANTLDPLSATAGATSDTRVGWTVGGGLEWMFLPNWSAKVEYLYYDLGNVTFSSAPITTTSSILGAEISAVVAPQSQTRFNGHIARAGVNYHFNWGAPVVASY